MHREEPGGLKAPDEEDIALLPVSVRKNLQIFRLNVPGILISGNKQLRVATPTEVRQQLTIYFDNGNEVPELDVQLV